MKKKLMALVVSLALILTALGGFGGCVNVVDIKSIEVKSGIKSTYYVGETVDLTKVVVTTNGSDNNKREVAVNDGITFKQNNEVVTTIDTAAEGNYEITVVYQGFEVVCKYMVSKYSVLGIETPSNFTEYNENIKEQETANKRIEFYDREQGYFVGDDNAFYVIPTLLGLDANDNQIRVDEYEIKYKVEEKTIVEEVPTYTEVTGDDLTALVAVDDTKGAFDFTEAAIGKTFKISVRPKYLTAAQLAKVADFTMTVEIQITDGYNCYTVDELSLFDNTQDFWKTYRQSKNIAEVETSALILHNNLEIKFENLPKELLYTEGDGNLTANDSDFERTNNSLRDHADIYYRSLGADDTFEFIGNYFTIDATAIPYVTREGKDGGQVKEPGTVISHAQLMRIQLKKDVAQNTDETHPIEAEVKNVNFVGNANRTEDSTKSGGLIMIKMDSINGKFYNTIANQWFIAYFPQTSATTQYIIDKCKAYDAFNSLMYSWGAKVFITNSEFIGAGGPAIIADHYNGDETTGAGGYISDITITSSTVESYVAGSEGWFTLMNGTQAAGQIKTLDQVFNAYGRSFLDNNEIKKFNLLVLNKSGAAAGLIFDKIRNKFSYNGHVMDFEDLTTNTVLDQIVSVAAGAPVFQTNSGIAYFDGSALCNPDQTAITDPNNGLFTGNCVNVFMTGNGTGAMGLVLGNYHAN